MDRLRCNNNDITKVINQIRGKQATFRVLSIPSFEGIADPNLKTLLNNLIIEIYKNQTESQVQKIRERQGIGNSKISTELCVSRKTVYNKRKHII